MAPQANQIIQSLPASASPCGARVIKLIGFRLRQIETRMSDLVFKEAPARLARLLLDLTKTMGNRMSKDSDDKPV